MMKVAIVTGASRGIGRDIALGLARKGFALYLTADSTAEELEDICRTAKGIGAPDAQWIITDFGVPGVAERMISTALEAYGRIDLLVNNAGMRCRKPFGSFTRGDFVTLMNVNLAAAFFASQAVLPTMRKQGGGRIIHIASQHGSVASEENALYGISKAALIHLARNMAYELAKDGIQVNTVSPGPIATQYNIDTWGKIPGKMEAMAARVPAGRMGRPEEVAEAVVFLATTEGRFIQGHDLVIDGGYIIH
jgi:NAD(P)-dependent dehydrogenase (short-subunit alcohol dehydrogenase family)